MSTENPGEPSPGENGEGGGALDAGRPAVAAAPARMALLLIIGVVFVGIVLRSLFFSSEPAPVKPKDQPKENVVQEEHRDNSNMMPITPSPLPVPPPPAPLPSPSVSKTSSGDLHSTSAPIIANITQPPSGNNTSSGFSSSIAPPPVKIEPPSPQFNAPQNPHDEEMKARLRSSMISYGGSASRNTTKQAALDDSTIDDSSIGNPRVVSKVKNLNNTIVQGKIVEAVLETAINSDLPGPVRAIVSHDTYAESGRDILIPKGSRLIGSYNSSVKRGQGRILIIWNRMVRPDGVDVSIDSPAIDTLGRVGQGGDVDNKYFEMFSTAILTSALDIGVAEVSDKLFGNQQSTTTNNTNGTSTTTATPAATAVQAAVQSVGNVGTNIASSALNLTPTISVDQGTPINVFVNHDLIFPFGEKRGSEFVE